MRNKVKAHESFVRAVYVFRKSSSRTFRVAGVADRSDSGGNGRLLTYPFRQQPKLAQLSQRAKWRRVAVEGSAVEPQITIEVCSDFPVRDAVAIYLITY